MDNGFAVIHANRLEDLTALTVDWIKRHPLPPLTDDVFLVESNGIAQWLKLALAADEACGIAAAQQFQMPARFLWQAYRSVLGDPAVPRTSPFDKSRLLWRLMRLLPDLKTTPGFEPLERFLTDDDDLRKVYQLSERLADLYDQYQVYRADWLAHWEAGNDDLPGPDGSRQPLEAQRWQALLWRSLRTDMPEDQRDTSRSRIHSRFLEALKHGRIQGKLPPRIIVFGISALPRQTLEALYALSPHCQILLLVQNPSEHYWGDIVEDRELLRRDQGRHAPKPTLAGLDSDALALAANPLLASWGKQGRDYINLLYSYDAPEAYQAWFQSIDLFRSPSTTTTQPTSLLTQVQQDIFALDNAATAAPRLLDDADRSLRFHIAHSPQREVEVLHDQLLDLLEQDDTLRARDIIVMVPDIQTYAPHIEAVFGALPADDRRHIPYTISDRSQQHTQPLAGALARLLNANTARFTISDILDLLEVSAIRARFEMDQRDLTLVHQWSQQAGVRWGFDADHRAALDLPEGLAHNSWLFGLSRMLLGYASGNSAAWQGIEPFDEVAGLSAQLAGKLAAFIRTLQRHWRQLSTPACPAQWRQQVMQLLDDLALPSDVEDVRLITDVNDVLEQWQQSCDEARFDQAVPVTVVRSVLLRALDQGSLSQRFLAGRVNFCTLMPMRSIPFRVVCLLGMNDGDYPRSQLPMDFDLMARRSQYRPGDRSRREDDRYLFLEALLSAREKLHISWVGRNIRDNAESPPSVLVAQLRDYLSLGWHAEGGTVLDALTLVHPLQPFSRDYFAAAGERDPRLFTYATEWREALEVRSQSGPVALPLPEALDIVVSPGELSHFLRQPANLFFNERLKVRLLNGGAQALDDEPFQLDPLTSASIQQTLLAAAIRAIEANANVDHAIEDAMARLCATGQLPPAPWDELQAQALVSDTQALVNAWQQAVCGWPGRSDTLEIRLSGLHPTVPFSIEGWLEGLYQSGEKYGQLLPYTGNIEDKPWRLLDAWVRHLCGNAQGLPLSSWLISPGKGYRLRDLDPDEARRLLGAMAEAWTNALMHPLPLAPRTGFACLSGKQPNLKEARKVFEGGFQHTGERDYDNNLLLRRSYPSFDALIAEPESEQPDMVFWADRLYSPLMERLEPLDPEADA